jgi:hypothetical protein
LLVLQSSLLLRQLDGSSRKQVEREHSSSRALLFLRIGKPRCALEAKATLGVLGFVIQYYTNATLTDFR